MKLSEHKTLAIHRTPIEGLLMVKLPVFHDERGWFKENWQQEKMTIDGLPPFFPVQHNVSFNEKKGTTRGIHAEPWDKYVSVANGRVFAAWVDLRSGPDFGKSFTAEIDSSVAFFVPRGVGNAFQTLDDETIYTYLVNGHWDPSKSYNHLNLDDETVMIPWAIPLENAVVSPQDRAHPRLSEIQAVPRQRMLILGTTGQLARELKKEFPDADSVGLPELDFMADEPFTEIDFAKYDFVVNAIAFTKVDLAESEEWRKACWKINATAVAQLAGYCSKFGPTLIHISTDYVFDGESTEPYIESDAPGPLNVYGQSKAAGDIAVSLIRKHYLLRTSWVVGSGINFVSSMIRLAKEGKSPNVVNDQIGRLTFASEIARAIKHLISKNSSYGTYNITNAGNATT